MDVLLLDAETCQISIGSSSDIVALRRNVKRWADPALSWREHEKRDRVREPSCYLVRLWGRTITGQSVCVVVPDAMSTTYRRLATKFSKSQLDDLAATVQRFLEPRDLGRSAAIVSIVNRHTTNCWVPDETNSNRPASLPWMRMTVANASIKIKTVWACRQAGEQTKLLEAFLPITGEKNVEVHTEVLLGAHIRPGSWFRVPAETAARCPSRVCADLVVQVLSTDLSPAEVTSSAPIRVLSFDIECFSESGDFPDSSKPEDPIITIGLYAETLFGESASVEATALCLGETNSRDGYKTVSFNSEEDLLLGFGKALRDSDADVVVGYNTALFDWPYITGRVNTLKKLRRLSEEAAADVFCISRVKRKSTPAKDNTVTSSAMGDNPLHLARMPGRFEVDLWFHLKRANVTDLPNLKLNTVAEYYLKDTKHDLPPQHIFAQYRDGGAAGRGTIAAYCIQDTKLVLELVKKLDVVQGITQMAAVTLVTPHDINFRGQQIRVYTQILRKARELNYVVEDTGNDGKDIVDEEGYAGAHVVEPKVGHYEDPIVTLDFASLYPSIMRTWNLSFDTLIRKEGSLTPSTKIPNTEHTFVKASVKRGLLPLILDELLAERKRVRKIMANCLDPLQRSLLNGTQLALKVSANSCYGFTGSTKGIMQCKEVAESTTGAGRHIIQETSAAIEREWPGSSVVYGDTDSCFVRLPNAFCHGSPQEIFEIGEKMAKRITNIFTEMTSEKSYIELEMEKYYKPLVLYKKKRYAGLCYKDPQKPPSMSAAGIEMVRRDAASILRETQKDVLEALVVQGSVDNAIAAAKNAIEIVLSVKPGGPFGKLAQSKTLRSKYANPDSMVHVKVAQLMDARQPGSAPRSGERVSYLVVASLTPRIVDKVDSVEYAEEHRLPPDWAHYVNMLVDPLMRLLEVPLQSLAPEKYRMLMNYFENSKGRGLGLTHAHSLARHGTEWLRGHKTASGIQMKLNLGDRIMPALTPPPKKVKKSSSTAAASTGGTLDRWLSSGPSSTR